MTTSVPLKVNKDLLDSSFDGYKLSLDNLPIYSIDLEAGIKDPVLQVQGEQSYLLTKLVGLFNNLKIDLFGSTDNCSSFYMCNSKNEILRHQFTQNNKFSAAEIVWNSPDHKLEYEVSDGNQLPVSINFPSKELAVVADGKGHIYILNTGDRTNGNEKYWELLYQGYRPLENDHPFIVVQSIIKEDDNKSLHCLLLWVGAASDIENYENCKNNDIMYVSVLDWLTFREENSTWSLYQSRRLVSSSYPDYVNLDLQSDAVSIASTSRFEVIYDSLNAVSPKETSKESEKTKEDRYDISDELSKLYQWSQTQEDIDVTFNAFENLEKSDVEVKLTSSTVSVAIKNTSVLKHDLWGNIDTEGSTWMFSKDKMLVLSLLKENEGEKWEELLKEGNENGKEVNSTHIQKLGDDVLDREAVFNAGEYEACDFSSMDAFTLHRMDGQSHLILNEIDLTGHQFLFTDQLTVKGTPVLCLRHDVDGLIWQPTDGNKDWACSHISTFNALGYVQASKQDRKYIASAPNFGFVALAAVKRHIHVYKQPSLLDSSVELRNRKSGRRVSSVAKQHVISLQTTDSTLGMIVTNSKIFVLTASMIYAIDLQL